MNEIAVKIFHLQNYLKSLPFELNKLQIKNFQISLTEHHFETVFVLICCVCLWQ